MTIRRTQNVLYSYKETQSLFVNKQGDISLSYMLMDLLGGITKGLNKIPEPPFKPEICVININKSLQEENRYNRIVPRVLQLENLITMLCQTNFDTKLVGYNHSALIAIEIEMKNVYYTLARMYDSSDRF